MKKKVKTSLFFCLIFGFFIVIPKSIAEMSQEIFIKIKYLDSSERIISNWSFLYQYAEHDSPPPEGKTWLVNASNRSTTLYLVRINSDGTKTSIEIPPKDIDRFFMEWEKSKTIEGWGDRTSFTLVKTNGDIIEFSGDLAFLNEYRIDDSFLSNKKYISQKHIYLVGIIDDNGKTKEYKLHLRYDNFALFNKDFSEIPIEIIFIKEK